MERPTLQIIHNPERTDRAEHVRAQLAAQGLVEDQDWWFVPAVFDERWHGWGNGRAHLEAQQRSREWGEPYALIGEDDLLFCGEGAYQHFLATLDAVRWQQPDWGVVLGGLYTHAWMGKPFDPPRPYRKIAKCGGSHLYAISPWAQLVVAGEADQAGYLKTASPAHPLIYDRYQTCADLPYTSWVSWPMAAVQLPGHSDMSQGQVNYQAYLRRYALLNDFDAGQRAPEAGFGPLSNTAHG